MTFVACPFFRFVFVAADMMSAIRERVCIVAEFRYKLTLEVVASDSTSRFEVDSEFDSMSDMEDIIPYDVARALKATMHEDAPNSLALASAMEGDGWSIVGGLAYAREKWDVNTDFDKCVKVVVDIDKLCKGCDDIVEKVLLAHGIEVVNGIEAIE